MCVGIDESRNGIGAPGLLDDRRFFFNLHGFSAEEDCEALANIKKLNDWEKISKWQVGTVEPNTHLTSKHDGYVGPIHLLKDKRGLSISTFADNGIERTPI